MEDVKKNFKMEDNKNIQDRRRPKIFKWKTTK